MKFRVTHVFLAVVVAASVLAVHPTLALAEGPAAPMVTPAQVLLENFESPASQYSVTGDLPWLFSASPAWWGRKSASGSYRGGLWGLWCAGTPGTAWPTYPIDSAGWATFPLPQSADYYAMSADFWYRMPSLGVADENSFVVQWSTDALSENRKIALGFPMTSAWQHIFLPLSQPVSSYGSEKGGNLSRQPGTVRLQWTDSAEGPGPDPLKSVIKVGAGPSVDDFGVTGWKYGPPRDVQAGWSSNQVVVTWNRPYASTAGSELETRTIGYRVFRTVAGQKAWTQLTSGLVDDVSGVGTYVDSTAVVGTSYIYAVQAFDAGGGWGVPATPSPAATSVSASLSGTSSTTLVTSYGASATVLGDVFDATLGFKIGGSGLVVLDRSYDGGAHYANSGLVPIEVLGSPGRYQVSVSAITTRTWFRLRFVGTSTNVPAMSRWVNVFPRAYLTTPYASSTLYHTRSYTMYGYLKPRHASGGYPVRLYAYRWEKVNGVYTWKLRVSVSAKAANYTSLGSTYTKYSASVRLPYAGRWRIRAYHSDAGHYPTYTSYRVVTVK